MIDASSGELRLSLNETFGAMADRIAHLLAPGLIANYDHVEINEIIATPPGEPPINVLTVAVLGENGDPGLLDQKHNYLTPRIRIDGFKNWTFGVSRVHRSIQVLGPALIEFERTGVWSLTGMPLGVGSLEPQKALFAPADATTVIPINRLLKNNFWAGSHVVRLMDTTKAKLLPFINDPLRLRSLTEKIAGAVPIALTRMPDFLGDVIMQFPVTLLVPRIVRSNEPGMVDVNALWSKGVEPRSLNVTLRSTWDDTIVEAGVAFACMGSTRLEVEQGANDIQGELWDSASGTLMAVQAPVSLIRQVSTSFMIADPEPRVFDFKDAAGQPRPGRIEVRDLRHSSIGDLRTDTANGWQTRRSALDEAERLANTREFVQYLPTPGSLSERTRAIEDIRFLLAQHGQRGADLWDPYLSADDLLATLFWSEYRNVPLRAITGAERPPCSNPTPGQNFPSQQKAVLTANGGNRNGLRLEYRERVGPAGWAFHDRFLIFPNGEAGPLAWSLGTSVNSLGKAHHILQKVSNGALVAAAFNDLWKALASPQHLIWRSW